MIANLTSSDSETNYPGEYQRKSIKDGVKEAQTQNRSNHNVTTDNKDMG